MGLYQEMSHIGANSISLDTDNMSYQEEMSYIGANSVLLEIDNMG
jgi:hypothetical protein